MSNPDPVFEQHSDLRTPWQRLADRVATLSAFSASAILHIVLIFVIFANVALIKMGQRPRRSELDVTTQSQTLPVDLTPPQTNVDPSDLDEVIIKSPFVSPTEQKLDPSMAMFASLQDFGPGPISADEGLGSLLDVISVPGPTRGSSGGSMRIVAAPDLNVGVRGNYTQITRNATDQIVAEAEGYKGVLVVWLIDASISMRDDAQSIAERVWDVFSGIRAAKLPVRMGVVYFGEKPTLFVKPTDDVDRTMRALIGVPTDMSGQENVMEAIDYCLDQFRAGSDVKRYICLLTDECGDDTDKVESTLTRLRQEKVTVYVMGREAFLRHGGGGHEAYFDDDTREMRTGVTVRGLCTPEEERAYVWPWWDYLPAGFGPYALSRVAVYTGGSYYMLGAKVVDDKPEPRTTAAAQRVDPKKGYDPMMMQYYRPDLSSAKTYAARLKNDTIYLHLQRILDRWESKRHWYRGYFQKAEIDTLIERCDDRLDYVEGIIADLNKDLVPDDELQKLRERRWVAHYDLCRASAAYAAWQFHQCKLRFYKAKEENHPFRLWTFGWPPITALADNKGIEERLRRRLFAYCEFVIRRHPGTPWAYAAQLVLDHPDSYLRTSTIVEYVPRDPSLPPPEGPPPI
ncbi:MAG: VWA domain-containing protein [Thermoleophilia bacterium]|nr:VWA domain-containing protein [Thermoleophilia bacterium]